MPIMLITVQCQERQWRVVHPSRPDAIDFPNGAVAFDFADAMAREHHASTGGASAVRVEVQDAAVEAVRYG
ncbi:hypothetical protein [Stenotrophomonas nematodicola]|jgi:hypothetical protein|nr:hypothetical protein G9274_002562 [Stenotrophomonas rhizophila]